MILAVMALTAGLAVAFAAAVGLSRPAALPPLDSVAFPFAAVDTAGLPPLRHFRAGDGEALAYRLYGGGGPASRVAVLVHGSSGNGAGMHPLAVGLAAAGWTVYAPDIRGHGASGRRGDVPHVGRIDADMAELALWLRAEHPAARLLLAGFSSGGGFVTRFAGGASGAAFDTYLLLAPYLGHGVATDRQAGPHADTPAGPRWASVAVPRLIALGLLDAIGVRAFGGLPVARFATPADADRLGLSPVYSYRLLTNFGPRRDVLADLAAIRRPAAILVGAQDELMVAGQYAPMVGAVRPDIAVTVVPGLGHVALATDPAGVAAAVGQADAVLPRPAS